MQGMLLLNSKNRCFLVEVIAKNNQNTPWKISLDGHSHEHEYIRRISIDKFYELVTGEPHAFKDLCEVLPIVLDDVVDSLEQGNIENSVFEELSEISPKLLQSLYLLSFSKYEGFSSFNVQ